MVENRRPAVFSIPDIPAGENILLANCFFALDML